MVNRCSKCKFKKEKIGIVECKITCSNWLAKARDFKLIIAVLPEKDVKEKLSLLIKKHKNITLNIYENWLIDNYVLNIHQFKWYMKECVKEGTNRDLGEVKKEVVAVIIRSNPYINC